MLSLVQPSIIVVRSSFRAEKVGSETILAQIVDFVKKAQTSRAPIQDLTDKISGIFVPAVVILGLLTFWVWLGCVVLGASFVSSLLYGVAVLIIACPCALGLATPTASWLGTGRSAKMGILLKNGTVLQEIQKVQTLVFDKTGTLTEGKPVVTDVIGDEEKCLVWQLPWKMLLNTHWLKLLLIVRLKLDLSLSNSGKLPSLARKRCLRANNGKQVLLGNAKNAGWHGHFYDYQEKTRTTGERS